MKSKTGIFLNQLVSFFFLITFIFCSMISYADETKDAVTSELVKLTVNFKGLRNSEGKILIRVYSSKKGFPDKAKSALLSQVVKIETGILPKVQFLNLPKGNYAVSAVHDENNSGEMDTNWIGIPREGLAVSRDAKGSFGPPSFKDAVLTISKDEEIVVNFVYL